MTQKANPVTLVARMFQQQDKLNAVMREDWRNTKPEKFHLAVQVEAAELIDHTDWKWWKGTETNLPQLKIETIDILHFGLSMIMVENPELAPEDCARLETWFRPLEHIVKFDLVDIASIIGGDAALHRRFNVPAFNALVEKLGMTIEEVYRLYMSKSVLNFFRREHGYAEGTYIKIWSSEKEGQEDNDYMYSVMDKIDVENFEADLYEELSAEYERVLLRTARKEQSA